MAIGDLGPGGSQKTVLITGATGFTGSSLVEFYAAAGWAVHGTFRHEPEDRSWLPESAVLHHLDLRNSDEVADLVRQVHPVVVHHLAANSSVAASWNDPMGTLDANGSAQFHLLQALHQWEPGARIVVAGSCDVYGRVAPGDNPVGEDHPMLPVNPYALSKVVQDLMAFQFAEVYGMAIIRARPFLQLGPRRAERFVAGSFARQVAEIEAGRRDPVIEVGNIQLDRDFTDVRDVARALAALAECGDPGEAYNIASGEAHSLADMLDTMVREAGIQVDVRPAEHLRRGNEAPVLVGNASKLRDRTGWEPHISFEKSVADTLSYWRGRIGRIQVAEGELA